MGLMNHHLNASWMKFHQTEVRVPGSQEEHTAAVGGPEADVERGPDGRLYSLQQHKAIPVEWGCESRMDGFINSC